jgi:serine/threonine protein kinase
VTLSERTLLTRYYLRERIDSGGMADVYLAWDQQRSVQMAVKVLRPDLMRKPNVIQLFHREAEILRKLEHPNIVRLYEFGQDGDVAFFVMDWVDGGSLAQLLKERKAPLSAAETARVVASVCSALHYAHRSAIFHCDIKPANIMLHADGRILLSDFGVARLASDEISGGTPPYMAPEQFEEKPVDARTDIYGLGVTLYEVLSGRQPFRGDSAPSKGSTLRDRLDWEHHFLPVPALRVVNPQLNQAIERVVDKAMAKQPDQRYETVIAFQEAFIQAVGQGQESSGTDERTIFRSGKLTDLRDLQPGGAVLPPPPKKPKENKKGIEPLRPPVGKKPPGLGRGRNPYLYCRQGVYTGQAIPIPPQGLSIGRGSQCSLRIADGSVSRRHATIECSRRGALYLRDDGSSLGTFLNGVVVTGTVLLKPGDVLCIGYNEVFEFRDA